jgi:hypothetical protein
MQTRLWANESARYNNYFIIKPNGTWNENHGLKRMFTWSYSWFSVNPKGRQRRCSCFRVSTGSTSLVFVFKNNWGFAHMITRWQEQWGIFTWEWIQFLRGKRFHWSAIQHGCPHVIIQRDPSVRVITLMILVSRMKENKIFGTNTYM